MYSSKKSQLLSFYSIARCCSNKFREPLDRCLDRFQSEFQENVVWYLHLFQHSRFHGEAPVLRGQLPPSRFFLKSPFWDDPGLNVTCSWNFQVDHKFYKLHLKFLATINKIRCRSCSCLSSSSWAVDPWQQKHLLFWH